MPMSHDELRSKHPSLFPPSHGDPPTKLPWVLLDLHAYVADRKNPTSAYAKMRDGQAIRVTFCTVAPPLVSYICLWSPDMPPTKFLEPTVEAVEADLVLFRVSVTGFSYRDYFVYKASGGGGGKAGRCGRPSLWRLEESDKYMLYRRSAGLLPHRDLGEAGPISPHAGDDGHFYVGALNYSTNPSARLKICLYNSMDKKWTSRPVPLVLQCNHVTEKVIALGEGGVVGFVDPWRGIVVSDLLGRRSAHYLPLPQDLIRLDRVHDEPQLSRDIVFVDGRLTLVDLQQSSTSGGTDGSTDCKSWDISTWSISSPWGEQDGWQKGYVINTCSIMIDADTDNVELLPKVQNNGGTLEPSLSMPVIMQPTLSLSDNRVVYLMGRVGPWHSNKKALVLSVDMMHTRLQGAAIFDAERMLGFTYTQSRISNFFSMALGYSPFKRTRFVFLRI